ncbi:MAG: hypothetical protein KJ620_07900 [Candidatus Edwardsbacteria bacterium]|nr:hypothetical protein [Candidatus Edwardsbacteria bacterium]MBU1576982.1 hypothetical protein [Candidatus Edwardsbacteria bacterium]MBU2462707.1 hypothetical protein [Candidatus Edwardsbacteria bacterium]MBU2595194.1 hypothetical protein [Candidatus Edwardsbacteria bacterium]
MRALFLALIFFLMPTIAFCFDWVTDAPRFDYQGYMQIQQKFTSIGSSYILTWHGAGIEVEHEEGDPFDQFSLMLIGGPAIEYDFYRLKGVYRFALNKHWNCRLSTGYGKGTSTAHFGTGILPLVAAAGLGFSWDGVNYIYSEKTETASMKVSLEADFWEIFKAELIGGVTYYSFSNDIKRIHPVDNWVPSLALALGVHTPWGR